MKLNKNLIIFTSILVLMVMAPALQAWGPGFHRETALRELLDNPQDTPIRRLIFEHQTAFQTCLLMPDVGVFYYYSNFKKYQGLHDWSFAAKVTELANNDDELACAYGIKVHLAEDAVSHNFYVPNMIRKYKIGNFVLHPVVELVADTYYYNEATANMFSAWPEYLPLIHEAINLGCQDEEGTLGRELCGTNFEWEAEKLNQIVGSNTFYDKGKAISKTNPLSGFYSFLQKIMAKIVDPDEFLQFEQFTQKNIKNIYDYDQTPVIDPSGRVAIEQANNVAGLWKYVLTIIAAVILFWVGKKQRWI